jgi:hypothetical protein
MEWIKTELLMSKKFWGMILALIIGIATWIVCVPKDIGGWIALGTYCVGAIGGWVTANLIQENIRK